MSFMTEFDRIRRRFSQIDVSLARDIWEDFLSGRPIENQNFLVKLSWQENIRNELRDIIREHSKNAPTRIYFLVGEPGSSKSQMLSEIKYWLMNQFDTFLIYHTCYDYRRPEYLNNSIIDRKNEIYSQLSMDKRRILDNLDSRLEIPALMSNLQTLSREFRGGVVILIDEIDYVNDSELAEWVNFFVSVNDRLKRGVLLFIAIMRRKLEKILEDTRAYRFVDDMTGKGIVEVFGKYGESYINRAFFHFTALYERAFGTIFNRHSLRFLKKISEYIRGYLGEETTIRRANSIIMSIVHMVAQIQEEDQNFFNNIYNQLSQVSSGMVAPRLGNDCEEGLKSFLETVSFKVKIDSKIEEVRFDRNRLHISIQRGEYVSDGSLIMLEVGEEEHVETLRIPIEIKFIGRNERIPDDGVAKILEVNKRRGIVVFIMGFYNENEIKRQLRDLSENQIIMIPGEIALLLSQLAIETNDRIKRAIRGLLRLILNIERRIKPYVESQHEYVKLKPMIERILSELPITPTLISPVPQQTQVSPQQTPLQQSETQIMQVSQSLQQKIQILARMLKETLNRRRKIGTIIKLMTNEVGIPRDAALALLKYLVERRILKQPRGWSEGQFLSPIDEEITEETIANVIAESEIIQ